MHETCSEKAITMIRRDRILNGRNVVIALLAMTVAAVFWFSGSSSAAVMRSISPAVPDKATVLPAFSQTVPATGNGVTPADVPEQEWQQIVAAMKATPGGASDIPRVGEYLTFQHRVERWQEMKRAGETSAERDALARFLLASLPTHVSRAELTGFEAKTLQAQLLEELVPDAAQRRALLVEGTKKLIAAEPGTDAQGAAMQDSQMADYKQRESEITAQWNAMSPAARDPHWLESQLDAARRLAFDGKP
jgi:hypothetical protein